jgi:DNA-binding transcriptional LysR family regulator
MGGSPPFRRGQLRCFVAVADAGQVTGAARALFMTQPAVSQAIAQLESELGFKLFDRSGRGVTLTPAGARFYEPARRAVEATADAALVAEALARASEGTIMFGFLGSAPALDSPDAVAAFAQAYPNIELRFQELRFPGYPTSSWLSEVDVAACHLPCSDPAVWTQTLRDDPRVLVAPRGHRLAGRAQLHVAEVLEETFIGLHPSVESSWAGFWSFDDERGGPPPKVTADRAINPQEVLASLAVRDAITSVPASVGRLLATFSDQLAVIPMLDAKPSTIALVGHEDRRNPLVETLVEFAWSFRNDRPGLTPPASPAPSASEQDRPGS